MLGLKAGPKVIRAGHFVSQISRNCKHSCRKLAPCSNSSSPPWVWSLGAELDLWTSPGWPIPRDPCAIVFNSGAVELFRLEKPSEITESNCYPSTASSITKLCSCVLQFQINGQKVVNKNTKKGEMVYFRTAFHALMFWSLREQHCLLWKCPFPAPLRSQTLLLPPSG